MWPCVRFLDQGRETDTSKAPDRPCWASVSQLWAAVAKGSCLENSLGTRQRGKSRPAGHHEVPPTLITYPPKPSSGERCDFTAGERVGPKSGAYPGSQRPAEPVASGFFGGSNRAEKCGSVKGPWRQAVGRGCQIFPERSHSVRCHNRGWRVFLLSAGQAERLAVQPGTKCGAKPRTPSKNSLLFLCIKEGAPPQKLRRNKQRKGREETPCPRQV